MHPKRLLIAGAGIAGLSLAIALRRRGIAAEIVERTSQWSGDGAGMYLIGLATRPLQELGLAEAAIRDGQIIRTQRLFDHGGNFLAVSDVDSFWTSCGPCFGASRANIHQLLVREAQDVPIRFGVSVTAIEQHANHVQVGCSDGSSAKYDLLIGADGIRSSVRRLELGSDASTFRGQMGWRFIAPLPAGIDGWSVFLGRGCTFLFVPIGGGKAYCYADQSCTQPQRIESAGHLERMKEVFKDFAPPVRDTLNALTGSDPIHYAPIEAVPSVFGRGRVVLIGDAAHATSPAMASGVAMALEDSLVLADIVAQGRPAEDIVPHFIRRRAPRVDWIRSQTDRRDRMRKLPPMVRNFVLRRIWPRLYVANYRPLLAPP